MCYTGQELLNNNEPWRLANCVSLDSQPKVRPLVQSLRKLTPTGVGVAFRASQPNEAQLWRQALSPSHDIRSGSSAIDM
jgi:hypothetical protein